MSHIEHKNGESAPLKVMVITISDTRDEHTDKSGQLMIELLQRNQFEITEYILVKDEKKDIEAALLQGCHNQQIDVILTNGGTGLAGRDAYRGGQACNGETNLVGARAYSQGD